MGIIEKRGSSFLGGIINSVLLLTLIFCPALSGVSAPAPQIPVTATSKVLEQPQLAFNSHQDIFQIINPTPALVPKDDDAGLGVRIYKNRFLYAHSTAAFAPLKSLKEGNIIYIENDGKSSYYKLSVRLVFTKDELDKNAARRAAIYAAEYEGKKYDYALMTCGDGTNDDEAYRLVFFAEKI